MKTPTLTLEQLKFYGLSPSTKKLYITGETKMPEFVDVVPESDPKQGKWEAALAPCLESPGKWLKLSGVKKTSVQSMVSGQTRLPGNHEPGDFEFKKVRNNTLPKGEIDLYVRFVG